MQHLHANTAQTSAQALGSIGNRAIKAVSARLIDIVISGCRNGAIDLSGKEIQKRYEQTYSTRIDSSTISARLNELVSAKRLIRQGVSRPCRVTGRYVFPVYVPPVQSRLVD
jgi:hypothetical protein